MKGNEMKKTQVFNVIILDRSGSMRCIRRAAVEGFNETLAGIKKAQKEFADTQDHFVTLVTFCSCGRQFVYDKTPVEKAAPLKMEDYEPCCCTPLYDAMGFTLTGMHAYVKDMEDVAVVVTVITDGLENASSEYDGQAIKKLVDELRGEGWSFAYMGANQDAVEVAMTISIRNSRNFDYSNEGTYQSMKKDAAWRMNFFTRLSNAKREEACSDGAPISLEERRQRYTDMADMAYDEEETKDNNDGKGK
ncbi:MAG: hypothetical protein LUB83_02055 [Prevotellaceae bacterium]|nr:hypothetical protein [Prevotellaceae bacterium]